MEENNTFLDAYSQYGVNGNLTKEAYHAQAGHDAIERWFDPSIAEMAQFARENYFVDKENAFNEYMFNKTNAYNTPTAQMQRMKDAGINPMLAAAGIAGTGAGMATPMQGASGQVGMNSHNINPIEQFGNIAGAALNLANAGESAGKLFGFGKTNKAELKNINQATKKMAAEAGWTREQERQARALFPYIKKNTIKQGQEADQNIKNLRELNRLYKEQVKTQEQVTDLTEKQNEGARKDNELKDYQIWEEKFYKAFRDLTGASAKDSWINMLVEACMNGKGEAIVDNIANFVGTIIDSAFENAKDFINETNADKLTFDDRRNMYTNPDIWIEYSEYKKHHSKPLSYEEWYLQRKKDPNSLKGASGEW